MLFTYAEYNKNNAYLGHENDNNVYDEFSTHSQINAAIYWNKHCNNLDHTLLIKNDYFNKLSLRIVKVAQSSLPLNAYNCVKNIFEIDFLDNDTCKIFHNENNLKYVLAYSISLSSLKSVPLTAKNIENYQTILKS